jgi:hypothetical protein
MTSRNNLAGAHLVANQPSSTRASDAGVPSQWEPVVAAAAAVARGRADPVVACVERRPRPLVWPSAVDGGRVILIARMAGRALQHVGGSVLSALWSAP